MTVQHFENWDWGRLEAEAAAVLGEHWRAHLIGLTGLTRKALLGMERGERDIPQGLSLAVALMKVVELDVLTDPAKIEALGEFMAYDPPLSPSIEPAEKRSANGIHDGNIGV